MKIRRILIGLGILGIASAQILPDILPSREKEDKRTSYTMESGQKYKVPDDTKFEVKGEFRLKNGSTFTMGKKDITLRGDVYIEKGSKFITSSANVILAGTGNKIVTIIPATWSGSKLLTATGEIVKFFSYLHVEPDSRTIIDPAVYASRSIFSGSTLLYGTGDLITATGSHVEGFIPNLGNVIIQ